MKLTEMMIATVLFAALYLGAQFGESSGKSGVDESV